MISKRKRRHNAGGDAELEITAFMNLMINLIPFLLVTAVFSKLTVLDLNIPKQSGSSSDIVIEEMERLDLILMAETDKITLFNGNSVVVSVEKEGAEDFPLGKIEEAMLLLKNKYPGEDKAIILSAPDISYQLIIQLMDICREKAVETGERVELFPRVSLGEI